MATYDRTVTGGGTVGHPSNASVPYVITSPVYDAVDNTSLAGDDVVKLMHKHTLKMVVRQTTHELRVVNHFKLCCIFVDTNPSSRY